MRDADLLVVGVPTRGFRATCSTRKPHVRPWIPVVSLTKGFESGTLLRMTQVIKEVLPGHPAAALDRARTWPRRSWPARPRRA